MLYQITIPISQQLNALANQQGFAIITDIGSFASNVVGLFLTIAGIAAFVFFAWGGLQYILSGSDKNKVEEAQARLSNAIIGLGVVAVSWAIFLLLNFFFGLGLVGGSSNTNPATTPSGPTNTTSGCLIPASRCCNSPDNSNSACFCKNPNVHAVTSGSCTFNNQPGTYCVCMPN
jgi:hypothetical protein